MSTPDTPPPAEPQPDRTVLVLAIGHEIGPQDAIRVQQAVTVALAHPGAALVPVPAGIPGSFAVCQDKSGKTETHHDDLPGAVAALCAVLAGDCTIDVSLDCLQPLPQKARP
jgi:hypothetical protein